MAKKNLKSILELPDFLGIWRESSKAFEIDLAKLTKMIDPVSKLEGKKELIGYEMHIDGFLLESDKRRQPRYVLFSLADVNEFDENEEVFKSKRIVRFSESGGNSHLGIVGGLIGELDRYLGLSIKDVKLYQSHHDEEPVVLENEKFRVKVNGGGFIYFDPKNREILLSGKSKTFDLYNGDHAVEHQLQVHNSAKGVIENWLQARGIEDYKVKII